MLPVPGQHMVTNALLACAVGRVHGLSLQECAEGLATAQLTKGRLELKTVAGLQILDDSYNANPDSMIAALKTLASIPTKGRRIAVLGRMGELGEFSEAGHRQVGDAAAARTNRSFDHGRRGGGVDRGERASQAAAQRDDRRRRRSRPLSISDEIAHRDDLILVKGSRSARWKM